MLKQPLQSSRYVSRKSGCRCVNMISRYCYSAQSEPVMQSCVASSQSAVDDSTCLASITLPRFMLRNPNIFALITDALLVKATLKSEKSPAAIYSWIQMSFKDSFLPPHRESLRWNSLCFLAGVQMKSQELHPRNRETVGRMEVY